MASLMDTLSGLARQVGGAAQSGGLGDLLGSLTGAQGGRNDGRHAPQQHRNPQQTDGNLGMGGLLGSAALGSVVGALLTNKKVRKSAGNAVVLGGGALAATLAWKYFQKWNAEKAQPAGGYGAPQPVPQPLPQASPTVDPWGDPLPAAQPAQSVSPEQEELAETLLMAMIFAGRSDGHLDEQEKANIDMVLGAMNDGGAAQRKLAALMNRPVNPQELADRVRTHEEAEDVYRLSCMIVNIDQFMERSYMDGLAKALHLTDSEKAELESQTERMKQQALTQGA